MVCKKNLQQQLTGFPVFFSGEWGQSEVDYYWKSFAVKQRTRLVVVVVIDCSETFVHLCMVSLSWRGFLALSKCNVEYLTFMFVEKPFVM